MIENIFEAVADALYAEFGKEYKIYSDPTAQGTDEPCFFVLLLNSTFRRIMDNVYRMSNQICIQYLPSDKVNPKTEFRNVIERLMTTVDDITVDGITVHGSDIHNENTDEVLNFFVNFDLNVKCERVPAEKMKDITITQTVKGE